MPKFAGDVCIKMYACISCRWGFGGLPQGNFFISRPRSVISCNLGMEKGFGSFRRKSGLRWFGLSFTKMALSVESFANNAKHLQNLQWRTDVAKFLVLPQKGFRVSPRKIFQIDK